MKYVISVDLLKNALYYKERLMKEEYKKCLQPIDDIIKSIEGSRVTARTLSADELVDSIAEIDKRLNKVSAKQDAIGTKVDVDVNAQDFPSAYKYQPESTQFTAVRVQRGWAVTSIRRGKCQTAHYKYYVYFTEKTREAMARRLATLEI